MSWGFIESRIRAFISSPNPSVLCISGKWGVGKTHIWKNIIKEISKENPASIPRYSYLSLFGLPSLDSLKYSIFENTVDFSVVSSSMVNYKSLRKKLKEGRNLIRKHASQLGNVPWLGQYFTQLSPSLFLTVRDQLICIDDLERKSDCLNLRDVLGLVSFLRDERQCRIVILTNDDALELDDKQVLDNHADKVVDIYVKFQPTPAYACDIAFKDDRESYRAVRRYCEALEINNIRTLKRIRNFASDILGVLDGHMVACDRALHILVLGVWCHYQPHESPPFDIIRKGRSIAARPENDQGFPWTEILNKYGYWGADELGLEILDGIRDGYFNKENIIRHAKKIQEDASNQEIIKKFERAWDLYHDSLLNNEEEVVREIFESFKISVQFITPVNLNGTMKLFRRLQRNDLAKEILDIYVSARGSSPEIFDLQQSPFSNDINDVELREEFERRVSHSHISKDFMEALRAIIGDVGQREDVVRLGSATVEDYINSFKTLTGKELRKAITECLKFSEIINGDSFMVNIGALSRKALEHIGRESRINAVRVSRFGISVTGEE